VGAAVDVRLGETVNQAALGRGKGGGGVESVQPFESEGWAGTEADEPLDAGPILSLDAHGSVNAEPARALPGEHAGGIELFEQSVATEVAEDALLDDRLHVSDAIGRQVMGRVKLDLAVVGLAEDAVEDDEVVMRVDVEGGAEAMKEADSSELGVRRRSWARAPERGANRTQQDLEHGAGDAHVVMEVRTEALGEREHPLPCGHVWQHVVGEVGGNLAHAASVAGRADASALAGERDQPLVATVLTAGPSEAMGQNAALEVAPEVPLDPLR
jgi:hypothetical protein